MNPTTEQRTDPLALVAAVIDALSTAEAALIGPSDEYEGCADALAKVRAVLHGVDRGAPVNSILSFEREAGRREGMKTAERIAEIAAEVAEREEKLAASFEEKVRHRTRAHYVRGIVEMIKTEAGEPPHDRLSAISTRTAARDMLATYDLMLSGDPITDAQRKQAQHIAAAACFAADAFLRALPGGADAHALCRAFLTALYDPLSPDLDYLRTDPAAGQKARDARACQEGGDA